MSSSLDNALDQIWGVGYGNTYPTEGIFPDGFRVPRLDWQLAMGRIDNPKWGQFESVSTEEAIAILRSWVDEYYMTKPEDDPFKDLTEPWD